MLSILLVISLVALPRFADPLNRVKLTSDAHQLAWVLRTARQEAINSGTPCKVKFYTNSSHLEYTVVGGETYFLTDGIVFVGETTFVSKLGGCRTCICYPSGACSGGTISLSNGAQILYVIVHPITGRIRISQEAPAE